MEKICEHRGYQLISRQTLSDILANDHGLAVDDGASDLLPCERSGNAWKATSSIVAAAGVDVYRTLIDYAQIVR
jgi:hypothetical protein